MKKSIRYNLLLLSLVAIFVDGTKKEKGKPEKEQNRLYG